MRTSACAALLVAGLMLACRSSPYNASDLQRRSAPQGAQVSAIRTERSDAGTMASWDVHTSAGWDEYRRFVRSSFVDDFDLIRSDETALVLSRHVGGDTYRLEFHPARTATGTDVRVRFVAAAD